MDEAIRLKVQYIVKSQQRRRTRTTENELGVFSRISEAESWRRN